MTTTFADLPSEIRSEIWRLTMSLRVVEIVPVVLAGLGGEQNGAQMTCPTRSPHILEVDQRSREEASRLYPLVQLPEDDDDGARTGLRPCRFRLSPATDILKLCPPDDPSSRNNGYGNCSLAALEALLLSVHHPRSEPALRSPSWTSRLRHLAFDAGLFAGPGSRQDSLGVHYGIDAYTGGLWEDLVGFMTSGGGGGDQAFRTCTITMDGPPASRAAKFALQGGSDWPQAHNVRAVRIARRPRDSSSPTGGGAGSCSILRERGALLLSQHFYRPEDDEGGGAWWGEGGGGGGGSGGGRGGAETTDLAIFELLDEEQGRRLTNPHGGPSALMGRLNWLVGAALPPPDIWRDDSDDGNGDDGDELMVNTSGGGGFGEGTIEADLMMLLHEWVVHEWSLEKSRLPALVHGVCLGGYGF